MLDSRFSKKQAVAARPKQQIEEETKMLRELIAALPFHKIIQVWERQQREALSKRHHKPRSGDAVTDLVGDLVESPEGSQ